MTRIFRSRQAFTILSAVVLIQIGTHAGGTPSRQQPSRNAAASIRMGISEAPVAAFQQPLAQQQVSPAMQAWNAGVVKRRARFDELSKRLEALAAANRDRNAPMPIELACGVMLESAFPMSVISGHKVEDTRESFHLLMSSDKHEAFDLMYLYSLKGILIASSIQRLPTDWQVVFSNLSSPTDHTMSVLTTARQSDGGACAFEFDLFDPFAATLR